MPRRDRDLADYERAYAENDFEVVQARMRKRMLLELLEAKAPRRVLEVGCGSDTLANHWRGFDRFVVVEPATGFARQARSDLAGIDGADVIQDTLEEAADQLSGQGFDLIVVSSVLHEVNDADALMQAVASLCGAKTLVHINVPNAHSLHRLLGVEMGAITDVMAPSDMQVRFQQNRIFAPDLLRNFAEGHGFQVVEAGSYFVKPFTHSQMADLRRSGFLTEAMIEGLWGLARRLPANGSEIFVNLQRR